jgi:hypothetical protein
MEHFNFEVFLFIFYTNDSSIDESREIKLYTSIVFVVVVVILGMIFDTDVFAIIIYPWWTSPIFAKE